MPTRFKNYFKQIHRYVDGLTVRMVRHHELNDLQKHVKEQSDKEKVSIKCLDDAYVKVNQPLTSIDESTDKEQQISTQINDVFDEDNLFQKENENNLENQILQGTEAKEVNQLEAMQSEGNWFVKCQYNNSSSIF